MRSDACAMRRSPTRSSRSVHDSRNPCLACARSPTIVRLCDGTRRSSIAHSASLSSWASSTITCANGPASASESRRGRAASSCSIARTPALSSPKKNPVIALSLSSSAASSSSSTRSRCSRSSADTASCRRRCRAPSGSPVSARAASSSGRSWRVHALASSLRSTARSSSASQGAQIRRYAGVAQRSATTPAGSSTGQAATNARCSASLCRRARSSCRGGTSSSALSSTRAPISASQTTSLASLCGVPGSGASNASVHAAGSTITSRHGVSTKSRALGACS